MKKNSMRRDMSRAADELFMMACLKLAAKGTGRVSPNPLVGAVIVKNGKAIGRGYHRRFGGHHAEVDAIRSAATSPRGATMYVNLEPCHHQGKTPPCTELIIKSNIRRVVVGMRDPNPLVSGKGIRALRRAGIVVDVGTMKEECEQLNETFVKYIAGGIPFVALKIAQTLDGKIGNDAHSTEWITNAASRTIVHHLRSRYDAVLVGAGTVRADNPSLTVRHIKGRNPLRIVLDGQLKSQPSADIFRSTKSARTLLVTSKAFFVRKKRQVRKFLSQGVEIIFIEGDARGAIPIRAVISHLGSLGIASILVEGGATIFNQFVSSACVDKMYLFIAPKIFGSGLPAFSRDMTGSGYAMKTNALWNLDGDVLIEAYPVTRGER